MYQPFKIKGLADGRLCKWSKKTEKFSIGYFDSIGEGAQIFLHSFNCDNCDLDPEINKCQQETSKS